MAMKMYKKNKLEYKNGYIVKGDKVVGIDNMIVAMFNELDTDLQKAEFRRQHPVKPVAEQPKFSRMTEHGEVFVQVGAETPVLDEMVEKTIAMLDEVDQLDIAKKVTEYMASIQQLIQWVEDDYVVTAEQQVQHRFDLPFVGNPLELDKDLLLGMVVNMFEE
jgi:hypothetical protein